jgi:hypothetical protein
MSNAEWITDRLPTEADGDQDGDVRMQASPGEGSDSYFIIDWSHVSPGVPWQRTDYWEPPTEPTPTEPDRIAALEQRVAELEAFKKALMQPSPIRYSLGN